MTARYGIFPVAGTGLIAAMCGLVLVGAAVRVAAGVHEGGVGACSYCHVMHAGGGVMTGNEDLLREESPSDVCLLCHAAAYGAVLGLDPLAPPPERGPGNFVFLLEDNINDGPDGLTNPLGGDAAGHNIVAPGHGLAGDGTYLNSPGGSYPAGSLGCTSCHDPHGNGNYRFLYGAGPVPPDQTFSNPAPTAVGLPFDGPPESSSHHVAYLSGVSRWCGNCHGSYLDRHNRWAGFKHTTDRSLSSRVIRRYNTYNGTADPSGGSTATAYLAQVPFEDLSLTIDSTSGPGSGSRIMCLTCHRAHATSGPRSGRWDFNVDTLGQDGVISGSYPLPNPYPDPDQDSLCRKCHSSMMGGGGGMGK